MLCCLCVHVICYKNRAIVLHGNLRLLPMLLQIREGLTLYGLSDIMAKYPDICKPLFVPGLEMKVSPPLTQFKIKISFAPQRSY